VPQSQDRLTIGCLVALAILVLIAGPATALADPITFAVRANTYVTITDSSVNPPVREEDITNVDEVFDTDDLSLIESSLTGSGNFDGYSGSGSALITDSVLGAFATATSPGGQPFTSIRSNGYTGFIDFFTVLLPPGSFVPMSFVLDPSYTIETTGDACGFVLAHVQVGGGGSPTPFVGSLSYLDSSCDADSLLTAAEFMVPTGVPFRVLYELSATAFANLGDGGTATVDALNSLHLFADPVGNYSYETMSGNSFLSSPASVPEPATLIMLGTGLGVAAYRRRRMR